MRTVPSQIDRRQSALLHRGCRRLAPDLWLAVRFLPRAGRDRLLAVAGVLRLLCDIVAGREVDREHEEGSSSEAHASGMADSGGCACGSGSLEARTAVAHHVIDFLFEQATAGAVGRPEMDVFIAVRRHAGLSRDAFDAWVDSLSRAQAQRRVATPAALERLVEGMARPIADILLGALFDGEPDGAWQSQAIDAAEFVVLARGLLTARAAWVEGDQCLIPLADLSSFGLRDMDLGAWLRGADVEGQLDERCARLMEHAKARALAPLASAVQLIDTLPGAPARALAAYLGLWAEALLSEPIGRRESPQPLNVRLKSHRFRAWRFAISCRFDPRLLAALAEAGSSRLSTATRPAT